MIRTRIAAIVAGAIVAFSGGCIDPVSDDGDSVGADDTPGPVVEGPWPAPDEACELGPASPTRLLLTTTDYSTGALSIVDTDALTVTPDVAVGSTDAIPFFDRYRDAVVVVHRFGHDYLDVLDDDDFAPRGQFPVTGEGSPNPQSVAFTPDGEAWVTTLGTANLRRFDLSLPPGSASLPAVSLSAFADDDGNPEASVIVACGSQIYVGVQRLDAAFMPVDVDMVVAIDLASGRPIDLDPDTPGGQGLALSGTWLRQLRLDPTDASGRTLLALTSGIERIDTTTGEVSWAVPEDVLAEAGIDAFRLPQSFAVRADGTAVYLAAYASDFSEVRLYVVGLDGHEPRSPVMFADGMDSVERTLERVGERLWYGSTRVDAPGLWVFDVSDDPPTPVAGPLPTGLPPYSMVALP